MTTIKYANGWTEDIDGRKVTLIGMKTTIRWTYLNLIGTRYALQMHFEVPKYGGGLRERFTAPGCKEQAPA